MPNNSLISEAKMESHRFLIGSDGEGHWIARDEAGLTGGVFADRTAAIHFAESESHHRRGAVVFAPTSLRLSLF